MITKTLFSAKEFGTYEVNSLPYKKCFRDHAVIEWLAGPSGGERAA
jgi:hypothetical protein